MSTLLDSVDLRRFTVTEYRSRTTLRRGDVVCPLCAPDVEIRVDELLP